MMRIHQYPRRTAGRNIEHTRFALSLETNQLSQSATSPAEEEKSVSNTACSCKDLSRYVYATAVSPD